MKRRKVDNPVRVSVVQRLGAQPLALLEEALNLAGFWPHLVRIRRLQKQKRQGREFQIVIKPDLDFYDALTPAGTRPEFVEHLIDLLHRRGFRNVVVGDGRNAADTWLHNRAPLVVPDLVGYRFATSRGRSYDVVGLHPETRSIEGAGPGSAVGISKLWQDACYRINFAKNKTHEECVFALCVHNLAGVATPCAVEASPHREVAEDCLQILRRAPPHFNIIDAFSSCHGGGGHRAPRPIDTHAFIACTDALLADWVGAAKMGVDPHSSPVNATALRSIGLPDRYEVAGELSPYPLWRNVHPLIAHSARLRNRAGVLGHISAAWFQSVDRERFPFKDFYNDRINSFISPLMRQIDDNPRSFLIVVLINHIIVTINSAVLAQHTMFSKNKLSRRAAPLVMDPFSFGKTDFEKIPDYLWPHEQLLEALPANRMGLRWRHIDDTVMFSCSHVFPIPFKDFIRAVNIAQAIQYMNDYIGGSTVAVRRDARGRVVHQAERNIYLQQPNWMVLFGGEPIDVEKLEVIRYGRDRQTIFWRTVGSPNASARFDDGSVSFIRTGERQTTVRILARQQFALPLFFRVLDINMAPGVRDPILESAYTTFFTRTIANMQAVYEGRNFRIGQEIRQAADGEKSASGSLSRYLATAAAAFAEILRHRGDLADFGQWLYPAQNEPDERPFDEPTDRNGFRHFKGAPIGTTHLPRRADEQAMIAGAAALARAAPGFLAGLAEAVSKDLDRMANQAPMGQEQ